MTPLRTRAERSAGSGPTPPRHCAPEPPGPHDPGGTPADRATPRPAPSDLVAALAACKSGED